jgi:hypothetical protein
LRKEIIASKLCSAERPHQFALATPFSLDTELLRLDAGDHTYYIYCPTDPRFSTLPDGALEAADHEYNLTLSSETRAGLDALGQKLLEHWHNQGDKPLTVLQVTESFAGAESIDVMACVQREERCRSDLPGLREDDSVTHQRRAEPHVIIIRMLPYQRPIARAEHIECADGTHIHHALVNDDQGRVKYRTRGSRTLERRHVYVSPRIPKFTTCKY